MIDSMTIQRVRDAASIVDVAGDFLELRKRGVEYECLCPFHNDRHIGSFKISPRKNIYYCFACNASGDSISFLMEHAGLSFADAIRYLGEKYGILVDDEQPKLKAVRPSRPRPLTETVRELPVLELPRWMPERSQRDLPSDPLAQWLLSLPWSDEQGERAAKVMLLYNMGHSKDGLTVFWQVDERGAVRTAKMMRYKSDGHRDKEAPRSWIHARLRNRRYRMSDGTEVCYFDDKTHEMKQTLYGMHLTAAYPEARINIVESEKTAIVCAAYFGHLGRDLWLATGGMSQLSEEKLRPLIEQGRYILLHPDKDGVAQWAERRRQIGYGRMRIADGMLNRYWRPEDGGKADLADIIERNLREQGTQTRTVTETITKTITGTETAARPTLLEQMTERHPCLVPFMEKLQLTAEQ